MASRRHARSLGTALDDDVYAGVPEGRAPSTMYRSRERSPAGSKRRAVPFVPLETHQRSTGRTVRDLGTTVQARDNSSASSSGERYVFDASNNTPEEKHLGDCARRGAAADHG